MRFRKKEGDVAHEGELTPMIDIVFQLIAFFMVLINFTQSEQDERIQLPDSVLAKPPDGPLDYPITLHLKQDGSVIFGGQELLFQGLRPHLRREASILRNRDTPLSDATVIIRGDKNAATGQVQELMKLCQEQGFENFSLRAKEDVGD